MEVAVLQTCGIDGASGATREGVPTELQALLDAITERQFSRVLADERYKGLTDPEVSVEEKRKEIERRLTAAVEKEDTSACIYLLSLGVASLLAYVQHNITGPEIKSECTIVDEAMVSKALGMDGEDFASKTARPDLLFLARVLLVEPLHLEILESGRERTAELQIGSVTVQVADSSTDVLCYVRQHVPSWLWWAGRVVVVQQKFLKHDSATLRRECSALLETLASDVLKRTDWAVGLKAQLCLEMGQWELVYRRIASADDYIQKAGDLMNVKVELSGAMGKRTVHQQDAKAQLIAQVYRSGEVVTENVMPEGIDWQGFTAEGDQDDVLFRPVWNEDVKIHYLTLLEQCFVLSKCDLLKLGTAKDTLRSWEVEPFTQLIQSQLHSTFPIQVKAALSRILHERERGRTKERSLLMLEKLVERVRGDRESSDRLNSVFSVRFLSIHQLRKQLAEHHISYGIVASALQTYEELEMWDELVLCYRLLDKKAIADETVTRQLKTDPDNPRLLCTLGDLRSDQKLFRKAWEASHQSYPRAQRSLARLALEKKDFKAASEAFELALHLNSLHPDAWFSLGYCYLKLNDDSQALKAFTWCAQLDPENGETWNNLAALWMRQHKPDRALWALKEAVKYKHNSWETWENYAKASQECGDYSFAIHGMSKVLELTDGQRLEANLLVSLIDAILTFSHDPPAQADASKLCSRLELFLRKASLGAGWHPEFWLYFAKLHHHMQQPYIEKECLMKCFRHLQRSTWKSDPSQFSLLVRVLTHLVEHIRTAGSQFDARSLSLQLRGIVKQAERIYIGSEDLRQLLSLQLTASALQEPDIL